MGRYRVGIIGCGSIARAHARGYEAVPDLEMIALADTNADARRDFGEAHHISEGHRYTSYREMLDSEQLDVVSVCSWHGQHAEMTIAAAARKPKVILCEKPMATNLSEADAMITAASRNGVKLAIGHMRRFYSGWEQTRDLIASGAIGTPERVVSLVRDGLLNWGTHTIDGIRFVLGDPDADWVMGAVERMTDKSERGMRVEDACMGLVQFKNGCQALIESDLTEQASINYQVVGSEGMIHVLENHVRMFNATSGGWKDLNNAQNDPFAGQAQGVLDWLDGKVTTYRGVDTEARKTLEIMMSVYESARTHQVVHMPLKTRAAPLELMIDSGHLPVQYPGAYDIRSFLVRGEAMHWDRAEGK